MSNILTPINPSVSRTVHKEEKPKDVSAWFKTEHLELNFGDFTGRPSAEISMKQEYLAQFLQTGWTIDAVMEKGESGNWVIVGGGASVNKNQAFYPDFQDSAMDGSAFSGLEHQLYHYTQGIGFVTRNYNTTPVTVSQTISMPSADAPAFWTAYQRIRLKRRRLDAEKVMQSMMDSFTGAYNAGRGIEDVRVNEVVALYKTMLSRSEGEGNAIVSGATDLMPLAQKMADACLASVEQADSSSDELAESATKNRVTDVNRQFDNLLAQAKSQMITNGTYNSTIWPSIAAGIERQRSEALDKANEAGQSVKFNAKQAMSTLRSSVSAQLLTAMQGVETAADQRKITVVELRNSVLKWMLDYIGSREESYPELEEISTVAERMGFSVGSAGSVL